MKIISNIVVYVKIDITRKTSVHIAFYDKKNRGCRIPDYSKSRSRLLSVYQKKKEKKKFLAYRILFFWVLILHITAKSYLHLLDTEFTMNL